MQDLSFSEAAKVLDLTRRIMKVMGIWPEKKFTNELIFTLVSIYLIIHCSVSFIEIAMNITDITYVVACSMEYMFIFLALLKIVVCKINRESLGRFIEDISGDFTTEKYKTDEEKTAFLKYNKFSQKFIKITLISGFAASSSYFFMSLVGNVEMVIANSSYGYKLPYKVWFVEPTNVVSYSCLVCYQYFIVPCLVFGYVGTDCLFICLVLHVSGCFSALSCTVKHILSDPRDRQLHLKNLVIKHVRLIRLSECLEDDFNIIILLQLIGSTFQFCLVGYDAVVSSESGEARMLFTFFLIVACVFSFLLIYCYIAECLIKELTLRGFLLRLRVVQHFENGTKIHAYLYDEIDETNKIDVWQVLYFIAKYIFGCTEDVYGLFFSITIICIKYIGIRSRLIGLMKEETLEINDESL